MSDFLSSPGTVMWLAIAAIAVASIVGGYLCEAHRCNCALRKAELEATLKQQMLDRGMSAAEIKEVLSASAKSTSGQSA